MGLSLRRYLACFIWSVFSLSPRFGSGLLRNPLNSKLSIYQFKLRILAGNLLSAYNSGLWWISPNSDTLRGRGLSCL